MATTREQMAADRDAFDDEFDQEHAAPSEPSEDEVFGWLDDEDAAQAGQQTGQQTGQQAGMAGANSAAKENTATPATSPTPEGQAAATPSEASEQAQKLQAWEQRLQQRQAELDAQAASLRTSNVNQQHSSEASGASAANETSAADELDDGEDPTTRLAEDFGQEFVDLVKKLVARECKTAMADCMGDVSTKVDQLIAELTQDRQQNHFKAIAAAHDDFMDVVASPEFGAWQSSQPDAEQADIARVVESGSAQEIIDLLTRFKQSKPATSAQALGTTSPKPMPAPAHKPAHQDVTSDTDDFDVALDAAEGVRSGSGLKLPKAPPTSDDYDAAWDEF